MRSKRWLILLASLAVALLSSNVGETRSSLIDLENSSGNSFEAWTSLLWQQTTQSDFEVGVLNNVDTSSSTGDVMLEIDLQEVTTSIGSEKSWYADWSYRKKITIKSSQIEADLDDFPVLINTTDRDFEHITKDDGGDIRVTQADGTTEIPREVEKFVKKTGELVLWTKVNVKSDSDVDIYIYYGNPDASEPAPDSNYGSEKVWDDDFKMVQHLQESPNDAEKGHLDSTSSDNDGTPMNFQDGGGGSTDATGKIGGADNFAGDDDWVNCGEGGGTLDFGTGDFTLEAWVKTTEPNTRYIISKFHPNAIPFKGYVLQINKGKLCAILADSGLHNLGDGSASLNDDDWHYIVVVFDRDGNANYYVDDKTDKTVDISSYAGDINNNRAVNLAQKPALMTPGDYFDGTIDEVRFSDIARPEDWIKTCYKNQISPSNFYTEGSEESWYYTSWSRRAPVTINNPSSGLTDYQVEVDVTYDADMQPDFGDIRFSDSDDSTELSYWRESYTDSTSATFWVKVPSIPAGTKTIYMYYGNDAAISASNGDATFEFFDDFEDGDISDWSQYINGIVQIADDGGNYVLLKTAYNDRNGGYSLFNNGALSNFEAVFRTKRINENGGPQNRYGIENGSFNGYGPRMYDFNSLPANFAIERRTGGVSTNLVIKSTSAYEWNTWMTVKFRRYGSTLEFELYDSSGSLVDAISTSNSLYSSFDRFVVHGGWEFYTDDIRVRKYTPQSTYFSPGTIASEVLNTRVRETRWDALCWDETLERNTDITFEVRASDIEFRKADAKPPWIAIKDNSPITSGLPPGQYMQWRATLTTSDTSNTPTLHEVRVYHY